MIKQIAHICIHARDLEETRGFYTNVLGMETAFNIERGDKLLGYYLKVGNATFIEVFKGDPGGEGNIKHVSFEVESIENILIKARELGVEATPKRLGNDQSWQCWLEDPNGIRIELHEYTPQSRQVVGGVCKVG